ncbi:hypothetical protein, partial [Nocardia tengchongensis]
MNESRQQRRARQRAEQKATTRPGPRRDQPPLTAKQPHVIVASLHRNVDDSEPEPGEPAEWVDWSCEYELRGESVGIDDSGNPDLHDVVNGCPIQKKVRVSRPCDQVTCTPFPDWRGWPIRERVRVPVRIRVRPACVGRTLWRGATGRRGLLCASFAGGALVGSVVGSTRSIGCRCPAKAL